MISCIIATHDRDVLLVHSIRSVLAQTRIVDEVVVVDDRSSADTRNVVSSLEVEADISGTRLIYVPLTPSDRPSAGQSRNRGAREAQGDVLFFLDDDDLWLPTYVDQMIQALVGVDVAVAWADYLVDGRQVSAQRMGAGLKARDCIAANPGLTGSNFVIRRSMFDSVEGFDDGLWVSNDRDFLIRILLGGARYRVVANALVLQRIHSRGQLSNRTMRRAEGLVRFAAKYDSISTNADRRYLRRELASVMRVAAPMRRARVRAAVGQLLTYRPVELGPVVMRKLRTGRLY